MAGASNIRRLEIAFESRARHDASDSVDRLLRNVFCCSGCWTETCYNLDMPSKIIPEQRIVRINDRDVVDGRYTLYWMQQSQRAECNHALEFAIQRANENRNRLLVCFALTDNYPDANLRHFRFMLEGLRQTERSLRARNIPFCLRIGSPAEVAIELGCDASELICDRGYLRHQVQWRKQVASEVACRVWRIESDAIVPVATASDKREYAARTIRSKLADARAQFMQPLLTTAIEKHSLNLGVRGIDLSDIDAILSKLDIDRDVRPVDWLSGGASQAKRSLNRFMADSLAEYNDRSGILAENVSFLSPYLHFGQISPLQVALKINSWGGDREAQQSFLEELLVRRELAINFVHYEKDYDRLSCLPEWAAETLAKHEDDQREHRYTASELDRCGTHDDVWNAAMIEMKHRGYVHNHLRMYWGKKIIQWTNTIQHALRVALGFNNRYFLDGRDANSYANVLWLFGLHDRAHAERKIFGKVRYMSADGLRRKFDVDAYLKRIHEQYGTG